MLARRMAHAMPETRPETRTSCIRPRRSSSVSVGSFHNCSHRAKLCGGESPACPAPDGAAAVAAAMAAVAVEVVDERGTVDGAAAAASIAIDDVIQRMSRNTRMLETGRRQRGKCSGNSCGGSSDNDGQPSELGELRKRWR